MTNFAGNLAKVLGGNLFAVLLGLATIPIITRLYSPSAYGQFVLFVSIAMIVTPLISLGYEKAVVVTRRESVAMYALVAVGALTAASSLGLIIVLTMGGSYISEIFQLGLSRELMISIPILAFLMALGRLFEIFNIRINNFNKQVAATVAAAVVERGGAIVAGLVSPSSLWLVLSKLFGHSLMTIILIGSPESIHREFRWCVFKRVFLPIFRRYRDFVFSALSDFLAAATRELPVILLAVFFSSAEVGLLGLGRAAIGVPTKRVSASLKKAFMQKLALGIRGGQDVSDIVRKMLTYSQHLIIPPILLLAVLADDLVPLIFGEDWAGASPYISVMALSFIGSFIYSPVSSLFDLLSQQKAGAAFYVLLTIVGGLSIVIGAIQGNPVTAVLYFSISNFVLFLVATGFLLSLTGIRWSETLKISATNFLLSISVVGVPVIALKAYDVSSIGVVFSGVICLFVYYTFVVFRDNFLRERLSKLF